MATLRDVEQILTGLTRAEVVELRRLGHDVVTMREAGRADRAESDESVLDFAASNERAVLTLNRRHFIRLHNTRNNHMGIIVCTFDPAFAAQAARIDGAIAESNVLAGRLIRVNRPAI